jgi:anthranilate/para-aminobenzoate synthase component II
MRVLVIDNYDSFTYNLVQYLGELGAEPEVVRNDAVPLDELLRSRPDRVVISPGPCRPVDAGISIEASRRFAEEGIPVLGVCHGKTAEVTHDGRSIFTGVETPFTAGRYHSLVVEPDLPDELELSAESNGTVMGIRHWSLPAEGVQFHPESVLTGAGKRILGNFLEGRGR